MHSSMPTQLHTLVQVHTKVREQLLRDFPGIDDETLVDTLHGLSDLRETLAEVLRSALEDEALLSALSTRLQAMRARQIRLSARAQAKRALVLKAMVGAELKSLAEPDFTAFVRRGSKALEIIAEEMIPPEFWNPQPPRLDRQRLLGTLKEGATVAGAALSQPQAQLSVRTR